MEYLSISQLAKQAEVNIETLRYYEKIGLIPAPARKSSGYRQYSPDYIQRIHFIKGAKELGFTLKEIQDLLELRVDADTTCDEVREQAEAKIETIEAKMKDLQRIKKALKKLTAACRTTGPTGDCPLLEALEN